MAHKFTSGQREGGDGARQRQRGRAGRGKDVTSLDERKASEMHARARREGRGNGRPSPLSLSPFPHPKHGKLPFFTFTLYPSAFLTWQSRSTSLPTGTVMLSISPTNDGSEAVSLMEGTSGDRAASLLDEDRHATESSLLVVATPGTTGVNCFNESNVGMS